MGGKAQLLRDIRKRISADQFEVQRRAFLYVARNTALSNTVRHKAQLGLNALNGGEGRMHAVKNRCVETGRGRGELPYAECRGCADGRYHVKVWLMESMSRSMDTADSSTNSVSRRLMARFQESTKQAGRRSMMDERERGWSMAIEEAGI
jgi:small subunit ribosomal protein S14